MVPPEKFLFLFKGEIGVFLRIFQKEICFSGCFRDKPEHFFGVVFTWTPEKRLPAILQYDFRIIINHDF